VLLYIDMSNCQQQLYQSQRHERRGGAVVEAVRHRSSLVLAEEELGAGLELGGLLLVAGVADVRRAFAEEQPLT
jgi:hypothetical protein